MCPDCGYVMALMARDDAGTTVWWWCEPPDGCGRIERVAVDGGAA